jgi:hypothetical protein
MDEGISPSGIVADTNAEEPNAYIREIFDREMGVTLHNFRAGSARDEAMRNLTKEAASLYAKRVLRELIQNAFDGASAALEPKILVRLDLQQVPHGVLYVANNGHGFTKDNIDAVVSPAMSNKTPGNFIGHKGLGFRSVELLSDDVQIYSMRGLAEAGARGFDGYRFGFAQPSDERDWLARAGASDVVDRVVGRVHRLQLPIALGPAPADIEAFAEAAYATVVRLPLRDVTAATRAAEELRLLFDEKAPITLFLHRLSALSIERIDTNGSRTSLPLSRQARLMDIRTDGDRLTLEEVTVDKKRFLVARMATDETRFRESIEASVAGRHPVERWREWKGAPGVAIALPLTSDAQAGAYYAFLPMERQAPFAGCLDAPFYPEADRRDLELSIPLNAFLLGEIAALCVRLAVALAETNETRPELTNAAVDALAWTDEIEVLFAACKRLNIEPGALRFPAMKRASVEERWSRVDEIYDWDDSKYLTLHRNLLVKVCDLPMLPARLGEQRRINLTTFFGATKYGLEANPNKWATWAPTLAADLARRRRLVRADWEGFYADLAKMPAVLPHLKGKKIFRLEDGSLALANGGVGGDGEEMFISVSQAVLSRRKGRVDGAGRIPPGSIVKKMRFADPYLAWSPAVATPFFAAQLATEYSLPRVLARLGKMMGRGAKRATVVAALGWAFEVWSSHRTPELDQAVKLAGLQLPAQGGGTKPPLASYFGAGWRDTRGDLLCEFLQAAPEDARTLKELRAGLLPDWESWPLRDRGSLAEWVLFLRQLGVNDGLKPILYKSSNRSFADWLEFIRQETGGLSYDGAFGPHWRKANQTSNPWGRFRYSSGRYETQSGDLLGLPGQAEHATMTRAAKLAYARLVVTLLGELPSSTLTTVLSRTTGNSDLVSLVSPIAAFLRLAPWLPIGAGEDLTWHPPAEAWFAPRAEPLPRFVPAIERLVRDLVELSKPTQDRAVSSLGLRLWNAPESAIERLSALGGYLEAGVPEAEHDALRKAYREAWEQWTMRAPRPTLPEPLVLAVLSQGKPRAVRMQTGQEHPVIFIGDGADPMREQLVAALGHLVLPLPERVAGDAAAALRARFGESFPLLTEADLTIRCDGKVFAPSAAARLLVEPSQEWLAEIAVLVLEFNEGLSNRNTARSRQALYDDFRKLRIVFARQVEVEVDGRVGPLPTIIQQVLAVPDPANPTLVVEAPNERLDWPLLARIARALPLALQRPSLAMPFRVAFLEMANAQARYEGLQRPSDETIALALGHPLARVQEIYRSLRSTTQRLFESLVPTVQVLLGEAAARAVLDSENTLVEDAQIIDLLRGHGADGTLAAQLLEACRSGESLDEVRRSLGLDLAAFNAALVDLGPPWTPLRFEARLRSQFDKRKEARRQALEQTIRDAYVDVFDGGGELGDYIKQRGLEDLRFDESWPDTLDDLPEPVIDTAIEAFLVARLPTSSGAADGPLETVRAHNRTLLMGALAQARRVVVAWIDKQPQPKPAASPSWLGAQEEILRAVVSSGALDFRQLRAEDAPAALKRAGLWPAGMPLATNIDQLGLTQEDLDRRSTAEQQAQARNEKARRTIEFGDKSVDGGAERPLHSVADALDAALTSQAFAARSGKATLSPFTEVGGGGGGGGTRGRGRDPEYMTDEQRALLGFAGEYAAYIYLKRTVRYFADTHWISSMGRRYLGLEARQDDDGCDFHVPRSRGADLFFEVKAHRGDPGYVELERTQVAAALRMADGRHGIWTVLYVPYVTSPNLISVQELQNPFAEASRHLYRELGKGSVRLEMKRT